MREPASGHCLTSVVASAFWNVFSAKGAAFTSKSATGRIRRGEPGAAPQDYGNPKTPALKARFTPVVSSMQEYRKPQQELSASIFDGRYV